MTTVYMTIGFLGSGKSTWAREFAKEHLKTKIVCPDAFREMLNGEYKYLVELDDIITESVFETAKNLLQGGYDVIVDCGNLTNAPDRRGKWRRLKADKFVAVIFPQEDIEWHVQNRRNKPHWKDVDWLKIAQGERNAFEPINENDYDEIIRIPLWDGIK